MISDQNKTPRRPMIYYGLIVMVALLLLNSFVFPSLLKAPVKETDYGTFLKQVEDGAVRKFELENETIYYTTEENGKEAVYSTGAMPDEGLTERLYSAGVAFSRVVPEEASPLLAFLLSWVVPVLFFYWLGRTLMKSIQKRGGGLNTMQFGKSNAKIYVQAETGKTFADVAGQEEAKEALSEIVDFLHNPRKYAEIGADLPKGVLLVGPPGTGKTLLAKAVAGEADVPFFSISGSEFVEMFVGMGAAKVRDLFQQANEKAPCIVFIDEIDTIGKRRDSSGFAGNDEREQTLNQLLSEMDGFDGKRGVIILAATNRPETLDKALLRPGRFDRRVPVELPDLNGREAILQVHAQKIKTDLSVNFNAIARATAGASGAELANIINEAALRAVRAGRKLVNQSDLEESAEVVIAGYQRKNAVISAKEKRIIAYHEIGHAIVAAKQENSAPVHKITIVPRTSGALGYTMQVEEQEQFLMSKEQAESKLATLTAGRAAEQLVIGSITSGASNDIEQATRIARTMVTRYGMSDTFGMVALETVNNPYLGSDTALSCSQETAARVDGETIRIIRQAYEKAERILKEHMDKLHELARYLLEKETITGDEFLEVLNRSQAA